MSGEAQAPDAEITGCLSQKRWLHGSIEKPLTTSEIYDEIMNN